MEIQRWITVNIFFNENEEAEADKAVKRYIARGYDDSGTDDNGGGIPILSSISRSD